MSPSISISIPNDTYQLLLEYRNETNMSQSSAGAALIKMGFAWNEQSKEIEKNMEKIRIERAEQEQQKGVVVAGITKAVKQAQKPRVKVKL